MGDAWGSATLSCHKKWPSLNLSRMMCHQDKFIGPVSMSQTFLHESIHLLGYAHGEDPEMAYACTLACGSYNEVDGNSLNLIDNKVKNLSKIYKLPSKLFSAKKIINAVNGINFSVYEGETLSIIGDSGSRKSTVAKMLNGLLAPDRGEILICNKDINKLDTKERAEIIQPVFQDPYSTLNPNHTIGYIIARPLILNKPFLSDEIRNLVLKTLDLVGLDKGFYYRFPNQLSGGQRQRVAIARAIILEPKILICDEPTSSLDVTIQEQILQLLKDLKQKLGITIILISHDISVVKYLSERVLVMLDGKIVESGDTISTLKNPKNRSEPGRLASCCSEIPRCSGSNTCRWRSWARRPLGTRGAAGGASTTGGSRRCLSWLAMSRRSDNQPMLQSVCWLVQMRAWS